MRYKFKILNAPAVTLPEQTISVAMSIAISTSLAKVPSMAVAIAVARVLWPGLWLGSRMQLMEGRNPGEGTAVVTWTLRIH